MQEAWNTQVSQISYLTTHIAMDHLFLSNHNSQNSNIKKLLKPTSKKSEGERRGPQNRQGNVYLFLSFLLKHDEKKVENQIEHELNSSLCNNWANFCSKISLKFLIRNFQVFNKLFGQRLDVALIH